MACLAAAAVKFAVRRQPAVLVPPAAPTPRELKRLSDIDDQDGLRFHVPIIQFYRRSASLDGRDPSRVIKDAVARALEHYYPFAGRLRELEGRKLAVDCTGEGVLFVEADADVRLEHFGDAVRPPFPRVEELLFDVPGSSALLDSPLLLFQVTRLACGGLTLAVRVQHAMADGQGMLQFLGAAAELARGAAAPTVQPVWRRELLTAREPPRPSFAHREYDEVPDNKGSILPPGDVEHRYFFFGPGELAAIRAQLASCQRSRYTTFEVLSGFVWKLRTMALGPDADEEMRLICVVSARGDGGKTPGLRIPRGYYGNSMVLPAAVSRAGDLCANPFGYAVELVREAKGTVVLRGLPHFMAVRSFLLTELTKAGFGDLDFGWGRPVYGGPAKVGFGVFLLRQLPR
ncbi:hypothetical protein C2845_PM13G22680 [Panicum miliaceum]|uniref:Benzyl alcohol O-benzoyltransferase-like n=1 Tax=Panicum miliaceum TaxID=4540 RepID=A0A3L6RLU3_PANMI|nr:hypothetical protein C2845_PM13G22680 [Panicum miliaceum]